MIRIMIPSQEDFLLFFFKTLLSLRDLRPELRAATDGPGRYLLGTQHVWIVLRLIVLNRPTIFLLVSPSACFSFRGDIHVVDGQTLRSPQRFMQHTVSCLDITQQNIPFLRTTNASAPRARPVP